MKVVINKCYGGFGISDAAVKWIRENKPCEHKEIIAGEPYDSNKREIKEYNDSNYNHNSYRDCPSLVAAVESLGDRTNGQHAELHIVDVYDNTYSIKDYDGKETICHHGCDC